MKSYDLTALSFIIIILFVVTAFFAFSRCNMSCNSYREGMQSHRLTSNYLLEDDAYGVGETSGYLLKKSWPYKLPSQEKENYSDVFLCNKKCSTITSATPKADCIQDCMNSFIGETQITENNIRCQADGDCPDRNDVCISPSYYGGGRYGYCMNDNEPGIPMIDSPSMREEYRRLGSQCNQRNVLGSYESRTCKPGKFYNDAVGRCENRFQGKSSALAVHMSKPTLGPEVTLPGSTFPSYGVGYINPVNVPVPERLKTDS